MCNKHMQLERQRNENKSPGPTNEAPGNGERAEKRGNNSFVFV